MHTREKSYDSPIPEIILYKDFFQLALEKNKSIIANILNKDFLDFSSQKLNGINSAKESFSFYDHWQKGFSS